MQIDPTIVELTRRIVMDVRQRRRAGEFLPDERVLAEYPDLREPLAEQLRQLRQLEQASAAADRDEPPPGSNTANISTIAFDPGSQRPVDIRATQREPRGRDHLRTTVVVQDDPESSLGPLPVVRRAEPGKAIEQTLPYRPVFRAPMAIIKLYHDGVRSFNHYPIMADRFVLGRTEGDLTIPHDVRMSSRHAEIQRRRQGQSHHWYLVDLDSRNGTFVRADRAVLKQDDELILGKEFYRFVLRDGAAGLTRVSGPPSEPWWFESNSVWIGRETPRGLSCFAEDEFLDPKHAMIQLSPTGEWIIKDASSLNGIWCRVQEVELSRSCGFQLGEQRFGFLCP